MCNFFSLLKKTCGNNNTKWYSNQNCDPSNFHIYKLLGISTMIERILLKTIDNIIKYLKDFFVGKLILDHQNQGYISHYIAQHLWEQLSKEQ